MMQVLSLPDDRAQALDLWRKTGHEPFAHPAFVEMFANGGSPTILSADVEGVTWSLPIVLRELAEFDHALSGVDAISPYGYGGPFGSVRGADPGSFLKKTARWAATSGLVSMFLRLSLNDALRDGDLGPLATVQSISDNVIVNLGLDAHARWREYDAKVRKNVKRAQSVGCTVTRVDPVSHMTEFLDVYLETMRRRNASDFFDFHERDLTALVRQLGASALLYAVRDVYSRIVSVELVLKSDTSMYSFLGGTRQDSFSLRPNDLLKHSVCDDGAQQGIACYVLGGGLNPDDGIFRYKRSFAPSGVVPFRVARIVGDLARYHEAMSARGMSNRLELESGFFPGYREQV